MKKTAKVLTTSILSIVMCASLAAGATYALFTSDSQVNVAITSGKVDVTAYADNLATYSATNLPTVTSSTTDTTSYGEKREKADFANEGYAEFNVDKSGLNIYRMTPGDKVTFDIIVTNNSNVTVAYQTKVQVDGELDLLPALTITIGNGNDAVEYSGLTAYSNWQKWTTTEETSVTVPVTIEFRNHTNEFDNQYQNKSVEFSYSVTAVQGNAATTDPEENVLTVYTAKDLQILANSVNAGVSYAGKTIKLMNDIDLSGINWTPIGTASNPFDGTFDGNGKTISGLTSVVTDFQYSGAFALIVKDQGVIKNINFDNNEEDVVNVIYVASTFSELSNTISGIDNGGIVILGNDVNAEEEIGLNDTNAQLRISKSITLDLNGFTIGGETHKKGGRVLIEGFEGNVSNVTITNGSIINVTNDDTSDCDAIEISRYSNVTLRNVYAIANNKAVFALDGNKEYDNKDFTVNIYGGTYETKSTACVIALDTGILNIGSLNVDRTVNEDDEVTIIAAYEGINAGTGTEVYIYGGLVTALFENENNSSNGISLAGTSICNVVGTEIKGYHAGIYAYPSYNIRNGVYTYYYPSIRLSNVKIESEEVGVQLNSFDNGVTINKAISISDSTIISKSSSAVWGYVETVEISNSIINGYYQGIEIHNADVTITNSEITGFNTDDGYHYNGIYLKDSNLTISNSVVIGDKNGIYAEGGTSLTVTHSTITGTQADAICTKSKTVEIKEGSTLNGYWMGLEAINTENVTVSNSTITGHNEEENINLHYDGIYVNSGTLTVTNSTVTGDRYGICVEGTATAVVTKCNVTGNIYRYAYQNKEVNTITVDGKVI